MFWHWKLPQRLLCSLKVIKISFGLEYQFCKYNILPYTVWTELNKSWKLPNFWGIFGGLFLNDMFELIPTGRSISIYFSGFKYIPVCSEGRG